MLDIKILRENTEGVKKALKDKGIDCDNSIDRILELDKDRREIIKQSEMAKHEQNQASKKIAELKKTGGDTTDALERVNLVKETQKSYEVRLRDLEKQYEVLMLELPNMPDPDLAPGGKENNETLRYYGQEKSFSFTPKNHVELCTGLGLIDYERGTKLSGSGFWVYRGLGARLEWALLNYFIDTHLADGYELILLPHMLGYDAGLTAGQFPKFENDVFWLDSDMESQRRFMLPTAETALVSLHRNEILRESDLPKKYVSYTPCFRREAGSYRSEERGMVRGHQFNKVEMVQYSLPENSDDAFEELVGKAEALVKGLGFHFRTVKLAAGDCSASMARTYDIEIHIPSMNGYKEVSSVSNARDYQARRGKIRFKRGETGKTELVHTLNGSGLATSRILPAIVEQNQQSDGSVLVPEVLRPYMGGIELITKVSV